jgi:coniferyl-aldehyde dehydrogenase
MSEAETQKTSGESAKEKTNGESKNGSRSSAPPPSGKAAVSEKPPTKTPTPATPEGMRAVLEKMQKANRKAGAPDYDLRIKNLEKLEKAVLKHKDEITRAVSNDYGNRSKHETLIAEILTTLNSIKHARAHLHEWMEPEPRETWWAALPARCEVIKQPLGVVGIIAPWNYPIYLSLDPLVYALAAGNRVMIKPSEFVPETSDVLAKLIASAFSEDEVAVFTGGPEVGIAFSRLPFDHLLFTGSTSVGKHIMRAAAENLVPVTLELGGKSPTIVSDNYSLKGAAEKIMRGKLLNAGQTCVAPDYVYLPKGRVDAFVEECKAVVAALYPTLKDNPDYTSVVNDRHYDRLKGYLADAKEKGAKIVEINPAKEDLPASSRKLAPTLVLDATDEMAVMQDEIFGPILPIHGYGTLDEALDYVNDHPRPLALYYFDHDDARSQRVLAQTISGGACINETIMHVAQEDMPFGGVGASGMGHYHGREGFDTFTKKRGVLYQSRLSAVGMIAPPYKGSLELGLRMLLGK